MEDEIYRIKKSTLTSMADAVRTKGGTTAPLSIPDGFNQAVADIKGDDGQLDALISGTIINVKSDIIYLRNNAFSNCHALKSVDLPNADKVRDYAFSGDTALTDINLPSATYIYEGGFSYCSQLKNATFPSVAKFRGDRQFRHCIGLTTLDFPVLVRIIGIQSFTDTSLQSLILRSPIVCELESSACFDQSPIATGTGYIYVPKALVDQYKAAPNWSNVAAQIRAIEDYPDITGG